MKTSRLRLITALTLALAFCGLVAAASIAAPQVEPQAAPAQAMLARSAPIVVDHTSTDITAIPQYWIEEAKRTLHIAYGHTSHGSQLTSGMSGLVAFANGGGKGLALPTNIFAFNNGGTGGALDLHDGAMGGDVGYYPAWVDNTRSYLGTPDPATGRGTSQPDVNVIIWSWCGQASGRTQETMSSTYLLPMSQLEADYPGVTFVYMTGHADGSGEEGNLHARDQQIREFAVARNGVLYDFYDIELYDPDGNYYGNRYATDGCNYDYNNSGSTTQTGDPASPTNGDRNWAIDWRDSHTQNVDWYSCSCAHSQALNCNQKAYAAWWLWARIAGWPGPGESYKTASTITPTYGQAVTYTVVVQNLTAPVTATLYLTDTLPSGIIYVSDTLTATQGTVNAAAPSLYWTGSLSDTHVVTITYAATVAAVVPTAISNTATIVAPGYQTLDVTATIIANGYSIYLPVVLRQ